MGVDTERVARIVRSIDRGLENDAEYDVLTDLLELEDVLREAGADGTLHDELLTALTDLNGDLAEREEVARSLESARVVGDVEKQRIQRLCQRVLTRYLRTESDTGQERGLGRTPPGQSQQQQQGGGMQQQQQGGGMQQQQQSGGSGTQQQQQQQQQQGGGSQQQQQGGGSQQQQQ